MIRNDDEFAKKLTGYLDAGTDQLRAGTLYRLQQARAQALARVADPARVGAPAAHRGLAHALAGGGSGTGGGRGIGKFAWLSLAVLLLAGSYFGYRQWQLYQETREIEELDAQILSSDLPIDAYLDRGFQTWLTRYQP
ncbi:MAG: DUF3619 family protein [Burkholderiales bacterium]